MSVSSAARIFAIIAVMGIRLSASQTERGYTLFHQRRTFNAGLRESARGRGGSKAVNDLDYAIVQKIASNEREQCCKDICECCELGYPVARIDGRWSNTCPDGYQRHCEAYKIRERAFKEQAKDE
jgi:hypothetical protein